MKTLLLVFALLVGCSSSFTAETYVTNPVLLPHYAGRQSPILEIPLRDKDLRCPGPYGMQPVWLHNRALFVVVSRDRLRFRVGLEHKFPEWTDLNNWEAYVEIKYPSSYVVLPGEVDPGPARTKHIFWDQERRGVVKNKYGDIVKVKNDGYKQRVPLESSSWYRAFGSVTTWKKDILENAEEVSLVLRRSRTTYRFTWNLTGIQ